MHCMQRIVLLASLIAIAPVFAGCSNFDPDKLDIFGLGDKKKLSGDRQPVFPEGVPGVTQGIPPEYIKGNQPPPDTAEVLPTEPQKEAAPVEKPKPKPKRTAQRKPKPTPKPTPAAASDASSAQPAAQQQPRAAWPAPTQAQSPSSSPWPAQPQNSGTSPTTAPWPSAPPPGTFTR